MPVWEIRAIVYLLGAAAFAFFGLWERHEGALGEREKWETKAAAAKIAQDAHDAAVQDRIRTVQMDYAAEQAKSAALTERISSHAKALQAERHRYDTLAGLVRVRGDVPTAQATPAATGVPAQIGTASAGTGGPSISAEAIARAATWESRAYLALHTCIAQYEAARTAK